jgi:Flp pilus assembly protein TadG
VKGPGQRRRRQAGNAIAEFGLAFPILLVFLTGMFQLGYAFVLYNELQSVIRTAGRYASLADFDSAQAGATFTGNVTNVVVYGTTTAGSKALVPGLTTSKVTVTWQADGAGIPQTITVKISSFSFSVLGTSFQLTNKPQGTFIYLGQFKS